MAQGKLRAIQGTDLTLTIDRTIQAFVEGQLDKAMADYGAYGGTILVMNPKTGAILASAVDRATIPRGVRSTRRINGIYS